MVTSEEKTVAELLTLDNVIRWYNQRYAKRPTYYQLGLASGKPCMQRTKDFIFFMRKWFPRLRLLDYGCGNGRYFPVWHQFNFDVVGVEPSWEAVKAARGNRFGFPIVLNDGKSIPFESGVFDIMACIGVLMHASDDLLFDLEAEFWRVLRPGGRLFIKTDIARRKDDTEKICNYRKLRFTNVYLDLFRRWDDVIQTQLGDSWLGWFMFQKGIE